MSDRLLAILSHPGKFPQLPLYLRSDNSGGGSIKPSPKREVKSTRQKPPIYRSNQERGRLIKISLPPTLIIS
ncbi:protein of unknown function [Limnospira indica PCC 8005]|uniref:Uncharacterized protein n=1 Tax=Limnospira indica PCC 8005 TaxID=376219 RepID=A0A9P1KGU3_9CYAN|nr:protein of unknown function [Limnospira indica PCC 8005]